MLTRLFHLVIAAVMFLGVTVAQAATPGPFPSLIDDYTSYGGSSPPTIPAVYMTSTELSPTSLMAYSAQVIPSQGIVVSESSSPTLLTDSSGQTSSPFSVSSPVWAEGYRDNKLAVATAGNGLGTIILLTGYD